MKLIRGGLVVCQTEVSVQDVLIAGEHIVQIGKNLRPEGTCEVVDATGCVVFPGFIDPHTHFDMTNAITTTCDDYTSGSKAAIFGGTTTVINFASPVKAEENALTCAYWRERQKADGRSFVDYRFHLEVIETTPSVLAEIDTLKSLDVSSLKIYMAYAFALADKGIIEVLEKAKANQLLVEAHAENGDLIQYNQAKLKKNGQTRPTAHPLTRPAVVESEAIFRLASLGHATNCPVHIVHLSSEIGLKTLRFCRELGYSITAETCPQYLWLDEKLYAENEPKGLEVIMAPPLRQARDRKVLLEALLGCEISTLATDHCAYNLEQKLRGKDDYALAPGGAPGVQTRAQLMYTLLVSQNGMPLNQFADLMATNAAKLYDMYPQKGVIQVGADADIVIYNPTSKQVITNEAQLSNAGYTPFAGTEVVGAVRDVFLRGERLIENGRMNDIKPQGKYIIKRDTL